MLKNFIPIATLGFSIFFLAGCQVSAVSEGFEHVPIEILLSEASSFDGHSICSTGFVKAGEGVYVYASIDDLRHKTYDKMVVLHFYDTKRPDYNALRLNQKVQFCGVVEFDKDCWREINPKISGPNCVPYNKPVDVNVSKFNYGTDIDSR